tara:strand:+ start:378 stop:1028 length:651 start_codon:yes stop_codon:yes gene_type:complete
MINDEIKNSVAEILIQIGSIKFSFDKPFTLTSGEKSPVYVDCRKLISFVNERNIILNFAKEYFKGNNLEFDLLAGGETAGIPYAAFLSEKMQKKMVYIRKKPKGFGNDKQIEGFYKKGQKAILIEDLATDGGSKILFVEALRKSGLIVSDIFVIFYYDIFKLSKNPISSINVKLHSLCTWKNVINVVTKKKLYTSMEISNLKIFLENPEIWRKENV